MSTFENACAQMVLCQLGPAGITDRGVLSAFGETPRDEFVPAPLKSVCYADDHLALGGGRSMMAPVMLARMIVAADIRPNDQVLCVGAGNGYAAAVVSRLCNHVDDFDTQLNEVGSGVEAGRVTAAAGDLAQGPAGQGYDVILVLGGAAAVPPALVQSLNVGGRLVCLVIPDRAPIGPVMLVQKSSATQAPMRALFEAYMSYLPGLQPVPVFKFG
jgi:protein-L-isoaspartate(D-aspartate) O-methyltransferase